MLKWHLICWSNCCLSLYCFWQWSHVKTVGFSRCLCLCRRNWAYVLNLTSHNWHGKYLLGSVSGRCFSLVCLSSWDGLIKSFAQIEHLWRCLLAAWFTDFVGTDRDLIVFGSVEHFLEPCRFVTLELASFWTLSFEIFAFTFLVVGWILQFRSGWRFRCFPLLCSFSMVTGLVDGPITVEADPGVSSSVSLKMSFI